MLAANVVTFDWPPVVAAFHRAAHQLVLPALGDYAVRGTLVLAATWAITTLLRRRAASVRHALWVAGLATVGVLPALVRLAPPVAVPTRVLHYIPVLLERAAEGTPLSPPVARSGDAALPPRGAEAHLATNEMRAVIAAGGRLLAGPVAEGAAILWIVGALCFLGRFVVGTLVLWRRACRATPVSDATWLMLVHDVARELRIRRPITLLTAPAHAVPVTWGIVYPVVLLPPDTLEWPPARRRSVLLHELAHVARLDAATQLVAQLALAVSWFNPLAWTAVARIRTERERACDDVVLTHGTRASAYAADLLTLVQTLQPVGEPAFAALAMARRSELEARVLAILDPHRPRTQPSPNARLLSLAAAAPFIVAVAAVRAPAGRVAGPTRCPVRAEFVNGGLTADPGQLAALDAENGERAILVIADDGRCSTAHIEGPITLRDDARDVTTVAPGGAVVMTEDRNGHTRRAEIHPVGDTLTYRYVVDGADRPWDEGRSWYAASLAELVRETAYEAPERIASLRKEGGVSAVLSEVRRLRSATAPRAYFEALLDTGWLSADERRQTANLAESMLTPGDRERILARLRASDR